MYGFEYYRYNTYETDSIPRDTTRGTPANPETCSRATDPEILSQYEHRAQLYTHLSNARLVHDLALLTFSILAFSLASFSR